MRITVVSLKKHWFDGQHYYTYGGFGDYVLELLRHFSGVDLIVPLYKGIPPAGCYAIPADRIKIKPLTTYANELWLLLKLPLIFVQMAFRIRDAELVNIRLPDMVGVVGWIWCRIYGISNFVSLTSDMEQFVRNENSTSTKGIVKMGLMAWIRVYLIFEKTIIAREISFLQGHSIVSRYKGCPKAFLWISSSLKKEDVRKTPKLLPKGPFARLLCVARVTRQKGIPYLIRSLHILKEDGIESRLTLVGKGDKKLLDDFFGLAYRLGLREWVEYRGLIQHGEELYRVYNDADIFVLPSLWEGTPKVLLEAMARGVPIVATNVGGVASVVEHEKSGLLVPPANSNAIAKAITRLCRDQVLWKKLSEEGRERASRYILSELVNEMIMVLRKHGLMSAKQE